MMTEELLHAVMEIAQQMIEVGAEIHRVEESVTRVCNAYGVKRVDVYATTSNVIVSVENADGQLLTQTRRILQTGTDIERLDRLNSLVRNMTAKKLGLEEVLKCLEEIEKTPVYPLGVVILFYGVIAGSFCLFFGGLTCAECIVATATGCLVGVVSWLTSRFMGNKLLERFVCSAVASISAFSCYKMGIIPSVDNVIIGNIMSLIPGIGLTNSLRDLFTGNSITGILRSIEALLLAVAIAGGYILTAYLFGGVL